MSNSKFYIYGGGRWREVDIEEGRVDGWGKARFAYTRRGKLHTAKTKSVLTALRNLSAKKKSSAKDGARLPEKKYIPIQKSDQINTSTQYIKKADASIQTTQTLLQESVQKSQPTVDNIRSVTNPSVHSTPRKNLSLKRKRSNSDENVTRSPKEKVPSLKLQKEVVHKSTDIWTVINKPKESQKSVKDVTNLRVSQKDVSSNIVSQKDVSSPRKSQKDVLSPRVLQKDTLSFREPQKEISPRNVSNPRVSRKYVSQTDAASPIKSQKDVSNPRVSQKDTLSFRESQKDEASFRVSQKNASSPRVSRKDVSSPIKSQKDVSSPRVFQKDTSQKDESSFRVSQKNASSPRVLRKNASSLTVSQKDVSSPKMSLKDVSSKNVVHSKNDSPRTQDNKNQMKKKERDQCKELIIEDSDVDILFKYLMKNCEDFDPLRFELDDEYKREFFFQINPLVNVTRCPTIAEMLKNGNKTEDTRLKHFVSNLGLQSVNSKSKTVIIDTSDSEMNKENTVFDRQEVKNKTGDVEKIIQNSISNSESDIDKKSKKLSKLLKELNENSNDSDSTDATELADILRILEKRKRSKNKSKVAVKTKVRSKARVKTSEVIKSQESHEKLRFVKNIQKENDEPTSNGEKLDGKSSHTISNRPSISTMREYTNSEDHTIISFVSVADRAKYVNGNRIWLELEEQFERLTGKCRTFHSLRNRYLRYILPSLGSLALPPSEVARLRAAAATGDMKARKFRRNSIFGAPSHGALSRRPGRVLNDSSDEEFKTSSESPKKTRPQRSPLKKTPRYSEITRNFADKHREDSTATNTPANSPATEKMTIESQENTTKSLDSSKNKSGSDQKSSNSPKKSLERTKSINNSLNSKNSNKNSLDSKKLNRNSLERKKSKRNSLESSDSDSSSIKFQAKRRSLRAKEKTPLRETRGRKLYNPVALL